MEPRGCNRPPLPEGAHGKQGVCDGLPPVVVGPLPAKEGVDADLASRVGYLLRLQSGHGQCSQPQPVHASRIMREILSPPRPVELHTSRALLRGEEDLPHSALPAIIRRRLPSAAAATKTAPIGGLPRSRRGASAVCRLSR